MKKHNYVLIAGIVFALASCGTDAKENQDNSAPSHEEHAHDDESIQLDDGKKWKVVDEMMGHISNMESDINAFEAGDEKNYASLAIKLEDNIDLLTSNCTMTGQAHDELHKWLLPYIELVTELSNAENGKDAAVIYGNIQISFKTFNTYFK